MGIPRFFKWISESFPDTIIKRSIDKKKINSKPFIEADALYIDANGIIHNCVKEIYFPETKIRFAPKAHGGEKVENKTEIIEQKAEQSEKQKKVKLFQEILKYIIKIYSIVQPKELLFIAIDGTAPVAKQAQQRQRRYKSAADKTDDQLKIFDTNAITPGTKFLRDLTFYINKNIKDKFNCDVLFSPPTDPGEGEHKLMNYIRTHKNLTHVVYGLDADLFMLTLSSHCSSIYLLREDNFSTSRFDDFFHIVKVHDIAKNLFQKWGNGKTQENFINDFIFICFLVGNDFLHNIPSLWDLEGSIDMMLLALNVQITDFDNELTVDRLNLMRFLKKISLVETELLSAQLKTNRYENKVLKNALVGKSVILDKYREGYYKKAGVENIDSFCKSYLEGLTWVNYYYHHQPVNWRWIFPYHYSPLLTDLASYLEKNSYEPVHLVKQMPLTENQQLLCVIPPKSKGLLPEKLQKYYIDERFKAFYPEKFERDLSGKMRDWEAIALLPFIDMKIIMSVSE